MSNDQLQIESPTPEINDKPNPVTWQERIANKKDDWFTVVDHSLSVKVIKS